MQGASEIMRVGLKAILYNDNLRQARIRAGFNRIKDLADELGIAQSTISSLERMVAVPTLALALKMEEVLGVDCEELFPDLAKKIAKSKKLRKKIYIVKEIKSLGFNSEEKSL